MELQIFKNYGCLAAEKRAVYTYGAEHPTAVCSDVLTVYIPEDWQIFENELGEVLLTAPWGWNYTVNEVLSGDEKPCFSGMDKNGKRFCTFLQVV